MELPAPLLLGLDVGTTATKAVLVDASGREVEHAAVSTPFLARGDRVEMEADALRQALGEVLAGLGDARRNVAGVGIAGMAECGAPLDRSGAALAPVIAWHDPRGKEAVDLLERRFGPELPRRLGQPVRTVLTVAKLGSLVANGLRGMARWLGVPELVLRDLTGAEATEHSLAARTGCYDVGDHRWMPEVSEAVGFPIDVFPPVLHAGSVMGRVSPDAEPWSGLPTGIPVTIAGHDHLAGMAGAAVQRNERGNSVGTAETIVARCPTLPDVAAALDLRVAITVYPGGDEWAALVGAARAGLVLAAASAALGLPIEQLDALAAHAPPAEVDDHVDALAGGAAASLPDLPPGQLWAGLLRALTARAVDGYERLTALTGPARAMVVFGGGAASRPWLAAKEASFPVPVRRSTVSAVARGAAIQGGVAAGWWPSGEVAPPPPPATE